MLIMNPRDMSVKSPKKLSSSPKLEDSDPDPTLQSLKPQDDVMISMALQVYIYIYVYV